MVIHTIKIKASLFNIHTLQIFDLTMNLGFATATTAQIKVSVESFYQKHMSDAEQEEFSFTYRITIENKGKNPVQLLSRKWYIADSLADDKIVEGEGVVGEQPVIIPGESYQYMSWCVLQSEIGKMEGWYIFLDLSTGTQFKVMIPAFCLHAAQRLN